MNVPITDMNCLGITFANARTSVTQKSCFRIICVCNCFGPHSSGKSKRGLSKGGLSPKGANRAKKARFSRKDFPPIFSENLGLKPPFVSPPLDFPK